MPHKNSLDRLSYDFFREFARCEYSLKVAGLREPHKADPTADWGQFASAVRSTLEMPSSAPLAEAIDYYLTLPPKKQAIVNGQLAWKASTPDHDTQAELVLRLVCRVRNNLFHGGKFNGYWFAPQRSEELLQHGLVILLASMQAHPLVWKAYSDSDR